ncbi:MAG: type II toxin-antitoxin system RelE/ParE family toxin [Balneolaceae bacterium]|nr:type II toxin-antitoxin system RelE/ParE family toxin [Balneolaceae bacterium]
MIWTIEFDNRARKELRKLDKQTQKRILKWLRKNLATNEDPRKTGKSLKGHMKGLWRYRVGDYRIISQIQDENILILVIRLGHRRDIYEDK